MCPAPATRRLAWHHAVACTNNPAKHCRFTREEHIKTNSKVKSSEQRAIRAAILELRDVNAAGALGGYDFPVTTTAATAKTSNRRTNNNSTGEDGAPKRKKTKKKRKSGS